MSLLDVFINIQIWTFLTYLNIKITLTITLTPFLINCPKKAILLGDFNISLPNYNEHQPINEFLDSYASNFIIPDILQPTRIAIHSLINIL